MSRYNLTYYGNDVLRQHTALIEQIDDDLFDLVDSMARIMYESQGVGLAGPQVGVLKRIVTIDIGDELEVFLNPQIMSRGEEIDLYEEGCLSLPEITVAIERPTSLVVNYMDLDGNQIEREIKGFLARVVQHECDHLDGKMIIDYMGAIDRELNRKKLRKIAKKFNRKLM